MMPYENACSSPVRLKLSPCCSLVEIDSNSIDLYLDLQVTPFISFWSAWVVIAYLLRACYRDPNFTL